MHHAVKYSDTSQIVEELLDLDAQIEVRTSIGEDVWSLLQENRKLYASQSYLRLKKLEQKLSHNPFSDKKATVETIDRLIIAAATLPANKIKILLDLGYSIDERNPDGVTPLMYAAKYNPDERVVSELLRFTKNIDAIDNNGLTALMHAASGTNNIEVIDALMKANADIYRTDNIGYTSLMYAARFNPNRLIIQRLLDWGATVNAQNHQLESSLHVAVKWNRNPKVAQTLIENEALTNIIDLNNQTPWDIIQKNHFFRGTTPYLLLKNNQ